MKNNGEDLSTYDILECVNCECPVKPKKVTKKYSCVYKCGVCGTRFVIKANGELKE